MLENNLPVFDFGENLLEVTGQEEGSAMQLGEKERWSLPDLSTQAHAIKGTISTKKNIRYELSVMVA